MGTVIELKTKCDKEREQTIQHLEQIVEDLKDNKITSIVFGCVKEDTVSYGSWTTNWLTLQGLGVVLMESVREYYNV